MRSVAPRATNICFWARPPSELTISTTDSTSQALPLADDTKDRTFARGGFYAGEAPVEEWLSHPRIRRKFRTSCAKATGIPAKAWHYPVDS